MLPSSQLPHTSLVRPTRCPLEALLAVSWVSRLTFCKKLHHLDRAVGGIRIVDTVVMEKAKVIAFAFGGSGKVW